MLLWLKIYGKISAFFNSKYEIPIKGARHNVI